MILFIFFVWNLSLLADEFKANESNYTSFLSRLKPGDILILGEGAYKKNLNLNNIHGTETQPIVIQGVEGKTVFIGSQGSNTVDITNCSYLEIKNLTVDGKSIGGIDGIKMGSSGVCHHIVLENNLIQNYDSSQQQNGISTKVPVWDITIRKNRIINTGTGMYLGNSDGTQAFVAGLIEKNVILNTIGYNCEIKHQKNRNGVLAKGSSNQTIIRDNVFGKEIKGRGDVSGARPNLLVGHYPSSGAGANDSYVIYNNLFYHNVMEEYLFQGEGNIYFFNNVLVNKFGGGANFNAHNDKPKNIRFFFNTVITTGRPVFLSGEDTRYKQTAFGNALFGDMSPQFSGQTQNLIFRYSEAINHLVAPLEAHGKLNVYPLQGKLRISGVNVATADNVAGSNYAFNDVKRSNNFVGAFEPSGDPLQWNLDLVFLKTKSVYASLAGDDRALLAIADRIARNLRYDLIAKDLEVRAKNTPSAAEMLSRLLESEKSNLQTAEGLLSENKIEAYDKLEELEGKWQTHEIGLKAKSLKDQIKAEVLKVKRDQKMAEANASLMLKKVKASIDALRPVNGKRILSDPEFKRINGQALQTISKYLEGLISKYPETDSAAEAKQLLEEMKQ